MECTVKIYTDYGLYKVIKTEVGIKLIDAVTVHHELNAPCGGHGTCGKCRLKASGYLSPLSETERGLLSTSEIESGIRLACLTFIEGDAEVWLNEEKAQILTAGNTYEGVAVESSFENV